MFGTQAMQRRTRNRSTKVCVALSWHGMACTGQHGNGGDQSSGRTGMARLYDGMRILALFRVCAVRGNAMQCNIALGATKPSVPCCVLLSIYIRYAVPYAVPYALPYALPQCRMRHRMQCRMRHRMRHRKCHRSSLICA